MEEVSLVLTSAQIVRLCLLVEYEIKRNEVLLDSIPTPGTVDHCLFEIDKLSGILDRLKDGSNSVL